MKKDPETFGAKLRAIRDVVASPELRYRLREMDRRLAPPPPACGRAGSRPSCERWRPMGPRKDPA